MNKLLLFLAFATLTACNTYDIKPGSERIRVFETEPKGCIFLGEIPYEQEDTVTGPAPEVEMSLKTRVELRNKAFALNANVIVFGKNKKPMTPATVGASAATPAAGKGAPAVAAPTANPADLEERKIKTVFLATVFRCPPTIVNQ